MKGKIVGSLLAVSFTLSGCSLIETAAKEFEKMEKSVDPMIDMIKVKETKLPTFPAVKTLHSTDQGWSESESVWFWNVPQGTFVMPYEWLLALERPSTDQKHHNQRFMDNEYMARYGFVIPNWYNTEINPGKLPIGFSYNDQFTIPFDEATIAKNPFFRYLKGKPVAGITCAACHTAQLNYQEKGLIIEGGPAMTDIVLFQNKLALAVFETYADVLRFKRFAQRILKEEYTLHKSAELKKAFKAFLGLSKQFSIESVNRNIQATTEGFGRLDALTRIGNVVFGKDMGNWDNLRPVRAPVNYPHLWSVPWFDWAQYNGSIRQPMVRNVGETLGVQALLNLGEKDRFHSSVRVDNLKAIENSLGGDKPLGGLQAPKYEDAVKQLGLPEINHEKVKRGAVLYDELCKKCHMPPVDSKEIMDDRYWTAPNQWGKRYLKTHKIGLEMIGTDPPVATDFFERRAQTGDLGLGVVGADTGLWLVTEKTAEEWYRRNNIPKEEWDRWNGYRKNVVLRPLAYRTRPLNGIWATAPYLHNGSVPNLYELLSPLQERSSRFYLGSKEFDPIKVGFSTKPYKYGYELDTSFPGNANTGHLFSDATTTNTLKKKAPAAGVIGRQLSHEERMDLIEYLKTL